MYILHVALQGCLRAGAIEYGLTADTGGHIRYLLDLVRHADALPEVTRQGVVTRGFRDEALGEAYAVPSEAMPEGATLVRLFGGTDAYLAKEDLHREHEALANALADHILAEGRRPDLLHAHYADGGEVARRASMRLGIPYVFTAHSLGRVKAEACGVPMAPRAWPRGACDLAVRVRTEERVIAGAARIVASSRDEAERQYSLYASADPAKIVVNPPGSYLRPTDMPKNGPTNALTGGSTDASVTTELGRFLADPSKPPLLAIARPVRKKNLAGLIEAYGRSPALQEAANLVIYAGTRDDIETQEPENREVLKELLYLMDRHDLWGRVALPKSHGPDDIPAIYAHAARAGGVFVNPALNEPFGLTLLEAAAAGLPVVATSSGGPVDIVERCANGVLVDPTDPEAIAEGALTLLTDDDAWSRCARAGLDACAYYDWERHARDYVALCAQVAAPVRPLVIERRPRPFILASDIDNTLTGDRAALGAFARWQARDALHTFAIATGRSLHGAIEVLRDWDAPRPDVMITSVGSEIYYAREGTRAEAADIGAYDLVTDERWLRHIDHGWDRARVFEAAMAFGGLTPQPATTQRRFKVSFFARDEDGFVAGLRRHLRAWGLQVNVIYSHGEFLDILPARASKGHALEYLRARLRLPSGTTIAAGDSGNDDLLLRAASHPVLVANYSAELDAVARLDRTYVASFPHAAGVLEGIAAYHQRRGEMTSGIAARRPLTTARPRPQASPVRKDSLYGDDDGTGRRTFLTR